MKKEICFVLDEFLFGGIERILINYVKSIDKSHYNIDIVVLSNIEDMINQIPRECKIIIKKLPRNHCPMYRAGAMLSKDAGAILYYGTYVLKKIFLEPINFCRFSQLHKKRYDTVIAFSGHINDMYATLKFFNADKKLVWAHGVIYQYLLMSPAFEKMYSKFDKIITINNINQNDIFYCKPYLKYNIESLYNPIILEEREVKDSDINELRDKFGKFILSVARLDYPKDFITLVNAYKIFKQKYNLEYNLVIVGDGPDRPKIEKQIQEMGLENHVFLVGSQNNVSKYYKAAEMFVFSSLAEGLPTVIIEAMKFGLPVVATDSPYGAKDIIRSNTYGVLTPVGDDLALSNEMHKVLEDKTVYEYYRGQSLKRYQDFMPDKIMEKFYDIIE